MIKVNRMEDGWCFTEIYEQAGDGQASVYYQTDKKMDNLDYCIIDGTFRRCLLCKYYADLVCGSETNRVSIEELANKLGITEEEVKSMLESEQTYTYQI